MPLERVSCRVALRKTFLALTTTILWKKVLFVPGSLLTVGAGFAFGAAFNSAAKGVFLASLVSHEKQRLIAKTAADTESVYWCCFCRGGQSVFVGAFLGSTGSFLLGRYLFRGLVVRLASRYAVFQAVDKALEGNGLKIMVLLRLSPLIPYNALDYLSGITSISLRTYCLGLIAILPGVVMFTFLGATASSLISSHDEATRHKGIQIFSFVFGVFFAVLGVGVASYYSKIELDNVSSSWFVRAAHSNSNIWLSHLDDRFLKTKGKDCTTCP